MAIPTMTIFLKILKIQEFTLVIIFVIFPQKWQKKLKNENFEISRNLAQSYLTQSDHELEWPRDLRIVLVLAPSLSKIQFGSLGELFVSMIAAEIKLKSTIQKQKKSNKNELKITQMLTSVPPFSFKPTKNRFIPVQTGSNWWKPVQTG